MAFLQPTADGKEPVAFLVLECAIFPLTSQAQVVLHRNAGRTVCESLADAEKASADYLGSLQSRGQTSGRAIETLFGHRIVPALPGVPCAEEGAA